MKKSLLSLSVLLGVGISSFAQDIHLSQYYASPITLNPAMTGLVKRDYRVAANFRTQNYAITSYPYITGAISYDMPILTGKLPEGDAIGVGGVVFYDKAGLGGFTNITGGLSFAYHKSLGYEAQHTISLGVQTLFVNKSIDFNKLTFGDQLDPRMPADFRMPTAEVLANQDVRYPDFNAGILYTGKISEKSTMYGGFSYYHLTRPEEKFVSGGAPTASYKINSRYAVNVGGSTELNPNIALFGSGLFQRQGPAQEILLGAATGFILNPEHSEDVGNTVLYLGAWYRLGDALIPYVGLEWTSFQLGFTYDVTLSPLARLNGSQGAMEVSLIYNGIFGKRTPRAKYNFSCPKF